MVKKDWRYLRIRMSKIYFLEQVDARVLFGMLV